MEIAPGIHNVLVEDAAAPGITNTYMLIGSQGAAFVDTGWAREGEAEARLDYIRKMGNPPMLGIICTHRHPPHWGNSPAIQEATGAPIISSPVEKEPIEERMEGAQVDRVVEDGEVLSLGDMTLEFVHGPGHTYGSLAVFVRESRALFTGDTVMGVGTSVVNPGEGEIALFLQTMDKFIAYNPSVIYPGQGPIITDPAAKLKELIDHRHEREEQILGLLGQSIQTVDAMLAAIYTDLDERRTNLARNQIRSHLIKLESEGRVAGSDDSYRLT